MSMRARHLLGCVVLLSAACAPDGDSAASSAPASVFHPTAAIEEVMRYIIDPAADSIWNAVVVEVTPQGTHERVPSTDLEWAALRGHAMTLIEGTNLLLMDGRRVAAPGSRSEMPGVDLEPEQIEALLAEDRLAWNAFVSGLYETGLTVLAAVDAKDTEALLVSGDALDLACENCHTRYWSPSLAADSAQ